MPPPVNRPRDTIIHKILMHPACQPALSGDLRSLFGLLNIHYDCNIYYMGRDRYMLKGIRSDRRRSKNKKIFPFPYGW